MPTTITTEEVWREVEKHFFAVLAFTTSHGEARSAGIDYTVRDHELYVITGAETWKARHITQNPHVSMTVIIPKRVPFMPWIPIPPATITFQGEASLHDPKQVAPDIMPKLLRGLKTTPEERASLCVIKIHPVGEFFTYGVGVSMQTMRHPDLARARAHV